MSEEVFNQANSIRPAKIYPDPRAGSYYTVAVDADLFSVSIKAYGYDKTNLIIRSNTILQNRPLDPSTNLPLIYQDDNIWLPKELSQ